MRLFGKAVSLETILDAIANKVGTSGDHILDDERVLVTLANELDFDKISLADQFLLITPRSFDAMQDFVKGGGNKLCGTVGRIEIDFWSRYEVDEMLRDREALRNASYGALATWKSVMKSLQLYAPPNDTTQSYLIEPMRFIGWQISPRRPRAPHVVIKSNWECKFVQDLS